MSFSFRNMFSQNDENAPNEGDGESETQNSPFMNPQNTGDGDFRAMFGQTPGTQPAPGADPRGMAPAAAAHPAPRGIVHQYLASELLAFIPPALAAQGGIPMERTVSLEMPADGSTEIRLSSICAACPELFAIEITPLNDSLVTLPPRIAAQPAAAPAPMANPGMDIASMRGNNGPSPFASNPFADAGQPQPVAHAQPQPVAHAQPAAEPARGNPFAQAEQETPSQFGFVAPAEETAQSVFSPFGAPPQPAAAHPHQPVAHPESAGATPTVGFSAISPSGSPGGNGASEPQSIFPGGNPFEESENRPHPAPAPPQQAQQPPSNQPAEQPNPFGGSSFGTASPFGAPASESAGFAAGNPFESNDSFSTIFSEKAQEDSEVPLPSSFGAPAAPEGRQPHNELPSMEALPPSPQDASNPFGSFGGNNGQPSGSAKNPFDFSDAAEAAQQEENEYEHLPPQSFSPPQQEARPQPQPQAPPQQVPLQPLPQQEAPLQQRTSLHEEPEGPTASAGFAPPSFSPADSVEQRSPFEPIGREPERPAAPQERPPVAAPEVDTDSDDQADSFDDLSPFTAAVTAKNSFFDEIGEEDKEEVPAPLPVPQRPAATQPAPPQPQAQPAPAPAPPREMAPAPRDTVVKNIELRAVFGSEESFTIETIARKTVAISGIAICSISTPDGTTQAARSGESTIEQSQITGLADSAAHIAKITGVADAGAFTMHTDRGLISIFTHESVTLFVRHLSGEFDPGVREKLMLITRGVAGL